LGNFKWNGKEGFNHPWKSGVPPKYPNVLFKKLGSPKLNWKEMLTPFEIKGLNGNGKNGIKSKGLRKMGKSFPEKFRF